MERVACRSGTGHHISWPDQSGITTWGIQQVFDKEDDLCFTKTAAAYILERITFDQYLDAILSHLKKDNPVKHKSDEPPKQPINLEIDLHPHQLVDLFGGSVKGLLWSPDFVPLTNDELETLRALLTIAWASDDVEGFQRSCKEKDVSIKHLAPNIADLVLIACYALRHIELFTHLLGKLEPPKESCFDRLGGPVVETRNMVVKQHQHSPNSPANAEIEARFWTQLLNSSWLHEPIENALSRTLSVQVPMFGSSEGCIALDSPVLEDYYVALSARNMNPGLSVMGRYLSECPNFELAERYVMRFKGDTADWRHASLTGTLLVKIVESTKLKDALRLEIIKLVLDSIEGLDLDSFIERPWVVEMRGFGAPKHPGDFFNALHAAAWDGRLEIAKLLVEYGANIDVEDPDTGKTAGSLARERGFENVADYLAGVKCGVDVEVDASSEWPL